MIKDKEKIKILKERSDLLKVQLEKKEESGETMQGLEFILANEHYLIDSKYIQEVVRVKEIVPLPSTPEFILGIINVHGKIIAIIDIKSFFNLTQKENRKHNRVVVLTYEDVEFGILVDEIVGNKKLNYNDLQTKSANELETKNEFVLGLTKERLIVLDIRKFILNKDIIINDKA